MNPVLAFNLSDLSTVQAFFLLHSLAYGTMVFLLWVAWRQEDSRSAPGTDFSMKPTVALIVPFRNERPNLAQMVSQIRAGIPPSWEVIWVDDHSEDGSLPFLDTHFQKQPFDSWRLIQSEGVGKKSALEAGIRAAKAEIIVTTDADVVFSGNPFGSLVDAYVDQRLQLVAGPVMAVSEPGFLAVFQLVEWASIQLVTGASFRLGVPLMCSGANLSFRRSAFFEVAGYSGNFQHLSGDDEFLLKKVIARFGRESVAFVSDRRALVQTSPFLSWGDLIAQRCRWASKWRLHGTFGHAFGSVVGFFFPVVFLVSPLLFTTGELGYWLFGLIWAGKVLTEGVVLSAVLRKLGKPPKWIDFLGIAVTHPVFVAQVAYGALRGNFTWKGRKSGLFH